MVDNDTSPIHAVCLHAEVITVSTFLSHSLLFPQDSLSLSLESRREMRHIETFFCAKKSTKFHLNKKLNFNKSVSYVRLRVGRVNIFIIYRGIGTTFRLDKYELSARLLIYKVYIRMWTFIIIRKV